MRDDEPADAVAELLSATLFPGHALGRPITGTVATMTAMRRDDIYEFWRERYLPSRAVVTAAGRLDHQQVVELAAACFDTAMPGPGSGAPEPLRPGARGFGAPAPAMRLGEAVIQVRPTEQANVMIGTAGLPLRDERRYVLTVLSTLLGGGMSSRLFQEVREKRGLAYTVQTSVDGYSDTGVFSVYAGAAPERIPELLDVVHAELGAAARGEISDEEVERAKGQVRGGIVIGLEDTGSRMGRLGRGELSYGEIPAIEELLDRVAVVTPGAVRDLAAEILGAPRTVALLGPDDTAEIPLDTYRNAG
jgi:predicted Zn-dependent peptidase